MDMALIFSVIPVEAGIQKTGKYGDRSYGPTRRLDPRLRGDDGRDAGMTFLFRHSRGGGNPDHMKKYGDMRYDPTSRLDPRLRGDDGRERGDDEKNRRETATGARRPPWRMGRGENAREIMYKLIFTFGYDICIHMQTDT